MEKGGGGPSPNHSNLVTLFRDIGEYAYYLRSVKSTLKSPSFFNWYEGGRDRMLRKDQELITGHDARQLNLEKSKLR
jgi:hypothetical protein